MDTAYPTLAMCTSFSIQSLLNAVFSSVNPAVGISSKLPSSSYIPRALKKKNESPLRNTNMGRALPLLSPCCRAKSS